MGGAGLLGCMARVGGQAGERCAVGHPRFDERYRAIEARDARFDGQFFTAVTSTGIYCRPSCPARTPKRDNVEFHFTSAAAHAAGFRACKRCLPEATPGSPEWDVRHDVAARAMRLIADGVVDRGGVDALAHQLGYTPRHLRRMLIDELGAGPVALARARRAQSARSLLVGTDLPITEVALASGFRSIRQFNDTVRAIFDVSPRELRASSKPASGSHQPTRAGATFRVDVALPVRQPFNARAIFAFLAARAVEGVESTDLSRHDRLRYARTLYLPNGPGAVDITAVRSGQGVWELHLRLEVTHLADVAPAVARVRRLLDLDADPIAVDAALAQDPLLRPLVDAAPGMRVPGAVDAHELLVRAIVGQQISVRRATDHLNRLTAVAGEPWESSVAGLNRLFPSAARILRHVPEAPAESPLERDRPLRLPRRSIATVLSCSRAVMNGELDLHVGSRADELRGRLVALPGIGPWTASYVAMRILGDPDAWLPGDVALVAGAKRQSILPRDLPSARAHSLLAEVAQGWAPWRSHAVMHLWHAAIPEPTKGHAS